MKVTVSFDGTSLALVLYAEHDHEQQLIESLKRYKNPMVEVEPIRIEPTYSFGNAKYEYQVATIKIENDAEDGEAEEGCDCHLNGGVCFKCDTSTGVAP